MTNDISEHRKILSTRSGYYPLERILDSPAQDIKLGRETQRGCDSECDHVQYLYRFKNGFGVSLAANHMTRTYWRNHGYMEAVVIYFPDPDTDDFEFVYMNTEADEPVLGLVLSLIIVQINYAPMILLV